MRLASASRDRTCLEEKGHNRPRKSRTARCHGTAAHAFTLRSDSEATTGPSNFRSLEKETRPRIGGRPEVADHGLAALDQGAGAATGMGSDLPKGPTGGKSEGHRYRSPGVNRKARLGKYLFPHFVCPARGKTQSCADSIHRRITNGQFFGQL